MLVDKNIFPLVGFGYRFNSLIEFWLVDKDAAFIDISGNNLLNNGNKFIEVETELITRLFRPKNQLNQYDLDTFLFEVTKAWWLAKGRAITISNIKVS